VEGDRGGGRLGEKGAGGVREAEEEGREAGFPRWQEAVEKEKNYAIAIDLIDCNRKHAKRHKPTNTGRELGLKVTGSGKFNLPIPPPSHHIAETQFFFPGSWSNKKR